MDILYQDRRILVCVKPFGVLSEELPELLRRELGDRDACIHTVNRLDQPAGGVMVLARSQEATRILSAEVAEHGFQKEYLAVVCGELTGSGTMVDRLTRDRQTRRTLVADTPGKDVREARLRYEVLSHADGLSLVRIELETGRTHQIRAQFSSRGFPLCGDRKYGAPEAPIEGIALWSHKIAFRHPQTDERMCFSVEPPDACPWNRFI